MTYTDPKQDIAFKKIFASEGHPKPLISLLNALLGLKGEQSIVAIEQLNPYQAPKINGLKESLLDIRAQDRSGTKFIVEMQVQKDEHFAKRALYYSSKAYSSQIERAQDYLKLNAVYFVGILNFNLLEGEEYLSRHLVLNESTGQQELKDLEWTFLELPKMRQEAEELSDLAQKWAYFFKNAQSMGEIPESLAEEAAIVEAFELANRYSWSAEELEVHEYWSMREGIAQSALETARHEGEEKGRLEGEKKGRLEGEEKGRLEGEKKGRLEGEKAKALKIAHSMQQSGMELATIVELTGLSVQDISTNCS